jgi:putative DNA primase/helicase
LFFKGYVVTKDKNCIEKFKGRGNLKALEQVNLLPEFAGILDDKTVLIDIDDFEQSELLLNIVQSEGLNCRVYQTTRGKHFLFRDSGLAGNRAHCTLAVGLTADIKLGKKNSYSILKFNGVDRTIIQDVIGDEADLLPKWLYPINSRADFLDMDVGDGRNQAMFNYILTLQSNDFSKEDARKCIRAINSHILKSPLPDDELETVLRDGAFMKPIFFKKDKFQFDKFAVFLKNNHYICKINNQLHYYQGGAYISGKRKIEGEMIKHIPQLSRAQRSEVYDYLDAAIQEETEPIGAELIAFRNGVYNIIKNEFLPFAPGHIITNMINWDYNPNAQSNLVDEVLDKISCFDPDVRALLEEIIGYCFYRRNELGKAFMFVGEENNGKSTYLDMIKTVLGKKNISALDLKELNERFKTAEVFGKLANIGDDIGDEFIPNTGVFKKLVTGDELTGERKSQDPFAFHSYAKLLFSANNIPRLGKGKDSSAIARRLIIAPFEAKFSPDDPDYKPYIKYELRKQPAMEYLIILGLRGLKRVLTNQRFTEGSKVQKELSEYKITNNPVLGFFEEAGLAGILNEPTNKVYRSYQEYCIRDNLQPLSNIEFSKQVKRYFNLAITDKKINGSKYRIFVEGV